MQQRSGLIGLSLVRAGLVWELSRFVRFFLFWPDDDDVPSACLYTDVQGTKNAPAPRPNKRPRLGPSPTDEPKAAPALSSCEQKTKKAKLDGKTSKAKPSTQLDEYMQVMQPRTKKGPLWVNDSSAQTQPSSIGNVRTSRVEFIETIGKGDEQKDEAQNETVDKEGEGISDLDWMKRRMKENLESVERVFEQSDDDDEITSPEVVRISTHVLPSPTDIPPFSSYSSGHSNYHLNQTYNHRSKKQNNI